MCLLPLGSWTGMSLKNTLKSSSRYATKAGNRLEWWLRSVSSSRKGDIYHRVVGVGWRLSKYSTSQSLWPASRLRRSGLITHRKWKPICFVRAKFKLSRKSCPLVTEDRHAPDQLFAVGDGWLHSKVLVFWIRGFLLISWWPHPRHVGTEPCLQLATAPSYQHCHSSSFRTSYQGVILASWSAHLHHFHLKLS